MSFFLLIFAGYLFFNGNPLWWLFIMLAIFIG